MVRWFATCLGTSYALEIVVMKPSKNRSKLNQNDNFQQKGTSSWRHSFSNSISVFGGSVHVMCTFFFQTHWFWAFGHTLILDSKRLAYRCPWVHVFFLYPICLGTRKIWSCGQHLLPTSSLLSIWMTWDRHNLHWASTPDLIIMTTARTSVPWWPFGQRGTCVTPAQKAISWNISYQNELGHKNFQT